MTPQTINQIIKVTASHFDVKVSEILSMRRARELVHPRHIAMTIATRITPHSLPTIGRAFGGRDHTTVVYARDKIEHAARNDFQLAQTLEAIAQSVIGKTSKVVRHDLDLIAKRLAPLIIGHIKSTPKIATNATALVQQKPSPKLPDINGEIHAAISTVLITHRQWQSGYFNRGEPADRQKLDQAVAELRTLHTALFTNQKDAQI